MALPAQIHTVRRWLEIFSVLAILGIVSYFVWLKPPMSIRIPGTNTVINMKEATTEIQNKLKGIDDLNKKVDTLTQQINQLQAQMQTNIQNAEKQQDIQKSMGTIKGAW